MKQIIINADDFGINEVVTSEIKRLLLAGKVSSTTVMANGTCLDDVKRFALFHPEVSFGVHLCLSEFNSITKNDGLKKAGIVNENGQFIHKAIFRVNNLEDKTVRRAIQDELNAQIDIISSLGFPISHADSHHHVHTISPLKELFADVLHRRGIMKVRLGRDFRTFRMRLHLKKWLQRNKLNKYYKGEFKTTDSFFGMAEFITSGLPIKDGETVELMCHPGHQGPNFQDEIKKLEVTSFTEDFKLISYNDLY